MDLRLGLWLNDLEVDLYMARVGGGAGWIWVLLRDNEVGAPIPGTLGNSTCFWVESIHETVF